MITTVAQRWRDRRGTYRPAGEVIDPRRYEVSAIGEDKPVRAFVEQHHYSSTYPAAPGPGDDPRAWLARWMPVLTRPLKHPGNLRYLWGLDRETKRHLERTVTSLPYPKFEARRR